MDNAGMTKAASVATSAATPTAGELVFNIAMFGLSAAATLAFAFYLLTEPARLNEAWNVVRGLPLIVQLAMWALLLPWMIALWVWTLPWALWIRLVVVIGVLLFTNYLLYPWKP